MKVWKNTSTLDGYDEGLIFTEHKDQADCGLLSMYFGRNLIMEN